MKEKTKQDEKPSYLGHRERLRARFLKDGGASMPDYEILELVLTYAVPRRDVKNEAKKLLAYFGSLAKVFAASESELANAGLTQNATALFKLVLSTCRRLTFARLKENKGVMYTNLDYVIDYCKASVMEADVEELHLMLFDAQLHLIEDILMQRGSVDSVPVYVREVAKQVILKKASSVILYHNHPSGNCQPSAADISMTKEIVQALKLLNVKVHDHLIVSKDDYYSFHDHRLTNFF